jgi:CRP/FNR family transcriptional regulator
MRLAGAVMKASVVTIEPNGHFCKDCSVREFSVCASLDAAELREFEHLGRRVHFAACESVFSEEDITTSFFNVLDGVMRLYKLLPDGRRQIVGFALPGDFLGMNVSGRHNFSADAIGAVTVCQFAKTPFGRFIEDKPHLLRRINELAVRELSQARDHMVLLGRRSAEEKVATFLLSWRERLVPLNGPSNTVPLPMSRQDIADYLGLTIETVSRTFTKLERDGVIEIIHGGITVLDPARAEALAAA